MSPEAVRVIPDLMNLCIMVFFFFFWYREILGELWNSAVLKASLARFIIVSSFKICVHFTL